MNIKRTKISRFRIATLAQLFIGDRFIIQINLRQIIHAMPKIRLQQIMRNHGIKHFTFQFNTILTQHQQIELNILTNLQNRLIFKNWFESL